MALPPVPPVADADRYAVYTINGVSTTYLDVTFPVYGDSTDLRVIVDGNELARTDWSLTSASGNPLDSLSQPITDGRVMFSPATVGTVVEIIGERHPRQLAMPTASGIARREFNEVIGSIVSSLRENWRKVRLGENQGLGFDAAGPLAGRAQYDDELAGFRYAVTDDADARPLLYVKLSDTAADWSQALNFRGDQGPAGGSSSGSVTEVATGYGLTGGPITETGTIKMVPSSFGWGFRNRLINAALSVDQRYGGTAATLATASGVSNYTVDRWYCYLSSASANFTAQRLATRANGINNFLRLKRASSSSAVPVVNMVQVIPTTSCVDLQSRKVTLSLRARAGANWSGANVSFSIISGTDVDESAASLAAGTWTGISVVGTGQIVPTAGGSWLTGALTVTVPALASQLAVRIWWTPTGTAGANDYIDVAHVQLEPGEVAAADVEFEHCPYDIEWTRCQIFYAKSYAQSVVPGTAVSAGLGGVTMGSDSGYTNGKIPVTWPVQMRAAPSVTIYDNAGASGKLSYYNAGWNDGETATVAGITSAKAVVSFTQTAYFASFDWTANAEL